MVKSEILNVYLLHFLLDKYGRRHVPYRIPPVRSPNRTPRLVSPFLSPSEDPVPPVGAQEEVGEDSRRDASTPAEQFNPPSHNSSPILPPVQV